MLVALERKRKLEIKNRVSKKLKQQSVQCYHWTTRKKNCKSRIRISDYERNLLVLTLRSCVFVTMSIFQIRKFAKEQDCSNWLSNLKAVTLLRCYQIKVYWHQENFKTQLCQTHELTELEPSLMVTPDEIWLKNYNFKCQFLIQNREKREKKLRRSFRWKI